MINQKTWRPRAVLLLVVCVLGASATNAQNPTLNATQPSLFEVLPSLAKKDQETLIREGQYIRFHDEGFSSELLPTTTLTALARHRITISNLSIGIEGLFFSGIQGLPALYTTLPAKERTLHLYNILRSVRTLTGLEYFSVSRGKRRLLFEESWAILDPRRSSADLPDPLVSEVLEEDRIYIHQKDKSFGSNQSEMFFTVQGNDLSTVIVNLSPLRYRGLIRVVDPGNMQTHLVVVPVKEGLLIYGAIAAQTRNVRFFLDRARNAFSSRIIALTGWYEERLWEEFTP